MRNAIAFIFVFLGLIAGISGFFSTASTSIHQIIQNMYLIQSLLAFIVAGVIYGKAKV